MDLDIRELITQEDVRAQILMKMGSDYYRENAIVLKKSEICVEDLYACLIFYFQNKSPIQELAIWNGLTRKEELERKNQ